ncbi:2'-5' RNA ligase family protein [Intrasporangium sp. YIM S08009]|uniref:2'-5' RNA ligase family protein n=1 Tax=Intrasporangium zincisolvens TaxID=3080018 RepID=UPI002B057239|nr:2'-5' RNA ligase family protein [Intrasporangium sp. YIM S08009]
MPVPALEPFVVDRHRHYDESYVSTDPTFVHAHVTALGPFLPPEQVTDAAVQTIDEITCATAEFDFTLERIATFPNGIVHLLPEPGDPFRALTTALSQAFPQCPPYAGAFPDPVPHLTLDALSDAVSESSTRRAVAPWVPAACRAERLDLAWYEPHRCRVLRSWRLGGTTGAPA